MRAGRWTVLLVVIGSLSLGPGCASEGGRRPVSGMVTFQGRPLERGRITFLTTGDPPGPAGGALIRDGRFELPAEQGLEPGLYRVVISSAVPGGTLTPEEVAAGVSPKARELIPPAYNSESTLTIEVDASGPNRFALDLK